MCELDRALNEEAELQPIISVVINGQEQQIRGIEATESILDLLCTVHTSAKHFSESQEPQNAHVLEIPQNITSQLIKEKV